MSFDCTYLLFDSIDISSFRFQPGDISEEEQCKKIVDETVNKFKRIDILVNNAAYLGPSLVCLIQEEKKTNLRFNSQERSIEGLDHDRVLYAFKTNVISNFDLVRLALPYMSPGSSIINSASQQAYDI